MDFFNRQLHVANKILERRQQDCGSSLVTDNSSTPDELDIIIPSLDSKLPNISKLFLGVDEIKRKLTCIDSNLQTSFVRNSIDLTQQSSAQILPAFEQIFTSLSDTLSSLSTVLSVGSSSQGQLHKLEPELLRLEESVIIDNQKLSTLLRTLNQ